MSVHIYSVIHLTYYIRVGLSQTGVSEVREGSAWRRPVARKIMLEQRHISVTALTLKNTYMIRVGLNQAGVSEVREGSAWRRPVARKIMLEQRHISVTALTLKKEYI